LFFIVGIVYAFTGGLPLFLMSCLVALQHECAHAFSASKLGYRLNKIVLMPFGAVIDGDLSGLSNKDEISIALCGPLCNLITAGFFVALWWCFPITYAYTDVACYVSLTIALVNLLPAYPLDGGRILLMAAGNTGIYISRGIAFLLLAVAGALWFVKGWFSLFFMACWLVWCNFKNTYV
jgi:stage IV sporulation protein FB